MSPPSRGRGSKPGTTATGLTGWEVAPFAGAWIETDYTVQGVGPYAVAPFAGAWIETDQFAEDLWALPRRPLRGGVDRNWINAQGLPRAAAVAPFAGAWIETPSTCTSAARSRVAPFAGAWIETSAAKT